MYGWVKVQISAIEKIPNNELRIRYEGGNWAGFITTKEGASNDIFMAIDENKIASIIACAPLTKQVFRP